MRAPSGKRPIINEYDDDGRLVATVDTFGKRIEYTHDTGSRQEVVKDRRGGVTVYEYDTLGNVTSITSPTGQRTEYVYWPGTDLVQSETSNAGTADAFTTTYDYRDAQGNWDRLGMRTRESRTINGHTITTRWSYIDVTTAAGGTMHVLREAVNPDGTSTWNDYYDENDTDKPAFREKER